MEDDMNGPQSDNPNLLSCVVILEEPKLPDPDLIAVKCFKKHGFKLDGQLGADGWSFVIDDTKGYLRLFHEQFEPQLITRPSLISTTWPGALTDCSKSHSHIFISTVPDQKMSKYSAYCQLTDLVYAVVEEVKTIGIYWPGAPKIIKASDFLDMANDPICHISCWVEFVLIRGSETVTVYTVGLTQFHLMEMEFITKKYSPIDLMTTAITLSNHLAAAGQVIRGGQTVSGPTSEVMKVQEKASPFKPGEKVLCFTI